ncbi:MAG: hypothetical protein RMY29_017495 [Nostoc sp. CreGUA01]
MSRHLERLLQVNNQYQTCQSDRLLKNLTKLYQNRVIPQPEN